MKIENHSVCVPCILLLNLCWIRSVKLYTESEQWFTISGVQCHLVVHLFLDIEPVLKKTNMSIIKYKIVEVCLLSPITHAFWYSIHLFIRGGICFVILVRKYWIYIHKKSIFTRKEKFWRFNREYDWKVHKLRLMPVMYLYLLTKIRKTLWIFSTLPQGL